MAHYWVGGTANWDGVSVGKWAPTSGAAPSLGNPTTADDVYFDNNSGVVTVTVVGSGVPISVNCKSLNFISGSGSFAGTFNTAAAVTMNVNIAGVAGANVTLSASATYTGSGATLTIFGSTSTLTANGMTWAANVNFRRLVYTITGNWTTAGLTTFSLSSGSTTTLTGDEYISNGGITWSNTNTNGTTNIRSTGGTNQSTNNTGVSNSFFFDGNSTLGTMVFFPRSSGNTIQWVSGTITVTGGTTQTFSTSVSGLMTISTGSNVVFNTVIMNAILGRMIFGADFYNSGSLTLGQNAQTCSLGTNAYTIYSGGALIITAGCNGVAGTTGVSMNSTSSVALTHNNVGTSFPLIFNSGANNITITNGAVFTRTGGSITYTSGNIVTTNTTLALSTAASPFTLNTSGMSWNNVSFAGTLTYTISSALSVLATLTISGSVTFDGTAGWTCANLYCVTAGLTITLKEAITYRTTASAILTGTAASPIIYKSSSTSVRAIWYLDNGATQDVSFVNGQWQDASLGQTIWSFKGVLTSTINWSLGTKPQTMGYITIN
jgi:hypothetical protein